MFKSGKISLMLGCGIFVLGGLPIARAAQTTTKSPGVTPQSTNSGKAPSAGPLGVLKEKFVDTGPYMVQMQKKIKEHWHAPQNPKHVMVRWQILPDGSIKGLKIERSSGDPASDKAAIDGVASSAPFAPLPKGMPSFGIEFAFGNEIRSGVHQVLMGDRVASQSLYNESIDLINKKSYAAALDKLEFALDRDPDNSQIAQALRYIAAYVDDETPDNLHILHRVLALDPKQPSADQKLSILHKAKGKDPTSAADRAALCDEYLGAINGEGALVEATVAKTLKADSISQDKMTAAYRILAGHRMARKWEIQEKARPDIECMCGLGQAYQLAGEYDKADEYYKKALGLDLGSEMAKALIAKLEEEKKTGTSSDVAKVAMAVHTTGGVGNGDLVSRAHILSNEGIELLDKKDWTAAISKFKEAVEVDPSYTTGRQNLAVAYNNYAITLPAKESVVYLHRALFVWPQEDLARKNLVSALRSMGVKPESFSDRMKSANEFAAAGNYTSAVVETKEALAIAKDANTEAKLQEFIKKAPPCP